MLSQVHIGWQVINHYKVDIQINQNFGCDARKFAIFVYVFMHVCMGNWKHNQVSLYITWELGGSIDIFGLGKPKPMVQQASLK